MNAAATKMTLERAVDEAIARGNERAMRAPLPRFDLVLELGEGGAAAASASGPLYTVHDYGETPKIDRALSSLVGTPAPSVALTEPAPFDVAQAQLRRIRAIAEDDLAGTIAYLIRYRPVASWRAEAEDLIGLLSETDPEFAVVMREHLGGRLNTVASAEEILHG